METTQEAASNVGPPAQEETAPKPFGEVAISEGVVDSFVTKVSKECLESIKQQLISNNEVRETVALENLQLLDITIDLLYSSYIERDMIHVQKQYLAAATSLMHQNPQAPNVNWDATVRIQSDINNVRQRRRQAARRYSELMHRFFSNQMVFLTDLLDNELVLHHEVSRLFFNNKFSSVIKSSNFGKYFTNAHRPTALENYHSPAPPPPSSNANAPSPVPGTEFKFRSFHPDRPFLLPALPSRIGVIFPRGQFRSGRCMPRESVVTVAIKASARMHYSNVHEDAFYTIGTYGERIFNPEFQFAAHVPFVFSSSGYPLSTYPAMDLIEDKRGTRKLNSANLERQRILRLTAPIVHDLLARKDTESIMKKHKEAVEQEKKDLEASKSSTTAAGESISSETNAQQIKPSTATGKKESIAPKKDLVALLEEAREARVKKFSRVHDATRKWMEHNKVLGFSEMKFQGRQARMNFNVSSLSRENPAATSPPAASEGEADSYWTNRKIISGVADALAHFRKTSLAYAAVSEEIYIVNNDANKAVDIMHYSLLMEASRDRLLSSIGIASTMELTASGEIQPTYSIDLDRLAMLIDDAQGKQLLFQSLPFLGEDALLKLRFLLIALLMEIFADDNGDENISPDMKYYLDGIITILSVRVLPKTVVEDLYELIKEFIEPLRPGMQTTDGSIYVQPNFPPHMSSIDLVRTEGVFMCDNLSLWSVLECAGKLNILSQTLKYLSVAYDSRDIYNLLQKACPVKAIDYILAEGERYCENLQFYFNSHKHHFPLCTSSTMLEALLVKQFENWNSAKEKFEVLLDSGK